MVEVLTGPWASEESDFLIHSTNAWINALIAVEQQKAQNCIAENRAGTPYYESVIMAMASLREARHALNKALIYLAYNHG